ncbi:HAMP domain-containing sensor histidine kinase [Luteococcus sanguinis]|uniref:histidine kinase n=1 Tax=Luteococcus sanguinis TaxID=174038 RepID=A0ABW1WZZ0_9ACTN
MSRAEEGGLPTDLEPVELDQFVVATTSAHRRLFQDADVGLRLQCDAGAVVDADPAQLGQVLDNLLRNALQHSRAGDRVDITTRLEDAGARVALEVADTGVGIHEDALPHLFERFYRDDSSRTREVDGGTGVGLSISRAIVSSLNGSIEAHSDGSGRGARFTVRLPTSPPRWGLQDNPAPT